jgi:hypothetical protein
MATEHLSPLTKVFPSLLIEVCFHSFARMVDFGVSSCKGGTASQQGGRELEMGVG